MAAFYRALLDLDVQIAPGPGLVPVSRTVRTERPGSAPAIVCAGFANRPKGYRLLPGAIEHVLQRDRDVTFLIHGIVDGSDAQDEQATFDRLSALGERVVVRQDVLAQEEYAAWLARADLVLLPYDREVYKSRGSGIFTEAQRLGIPVIATGGCAFAQPAFEGGWGVEIADYSSEGVARAALAALGRLDELTARATHRRPRGQRPARRHPGRNRRRGPEAGLRGPCRPGSNGFVGRNFRPRPLAIPDA